MGKFFKTWIGIFVLFLANGTALSAISNKSTNNLVGGLFQVQVTKDLTETTSSHAALEAGERNLRASGTFGWGMNSQNRLKLTGEYLQQYLDYNFITGTTRQWVQQGAIGIGYQYAFNNAQQNYFNLTGYYSYAPNYNLNTITQTLTDTSGRTTVLTDVRRIAGSDASGLSPGIALHLWQGSEVKLSLNYDNVIYHNSLGPQVKSQGFGGTAVMSQAFVVNAENFLVSASAANRAPYNDYRLNVDWVKSSAFSHVKFGVYGGYTQGKKSLPNSTMVGLNLSFIFDTPKPYIDEMNYYQDLSAWVSEPAVRMPVVLAIADEEVISSGFCIPPSVHGQIPEQSGHEGSSYTLATADYFYSNGQQLTYSATGLPGTLDIDQASGVISGNLPTGGAQTFNVVVTASSQCGSAGQSFKLDVLSG